MYSMTGEQTKEVLDLSVRSLSLDVTGINMFGAIIKQYFAICKNVVLVVFAFQANLKVAFSPVQYHMVNAKDA